MKRDSDLLSLRYFQFLQRADWGCVCRNVEIRYPVDARNMKLICLLYDFAPCTEYMVSICVVTIYRELPLVIYHASRKWYFNHHLIVKNAFPRRELRILTLQRAPDIKSKIAFSLTFLLDSGHALVSFVGSGARLLYFLNMVCSRALPHL
jgi:hypothetical protein